MTTITSSPTTQRPQRSRDEIRRELHEHTEAIFNRIFSEDNSQPSPSFDQIETQILQLTRDLDSWLLEQRVQSAEAGRPVEPPSCPGCGRAAHRVGKPDDPLPRRVLTTRAGPIDLAREKWRCTTCRVVFFPPRRAVEADPRGIQSRTH
jgi:hypothetical protein